MPDDTQQDHVQAASREGRRDFLTLSSSVAMGAGLVAGYGSLAVMAGRFLYPADGELVAWQFLTTIDRLEVGQSLTYTAPSGARVLVARQGEGATVEDFIALSSVCPHLGCQVHWEPHHERFFCPCHNGAFDPQGRAILGPPAKARQQLVRFPLMVQDGLLFIEVPLESVTSRQVAAGAASPARGRQGDTA